MDGTQLSNKAGVTLTGNWTLPTVGIPETIQNADSETHGFLSTNGNIVAGSEVIEEAFDPSDNAGQQWTRSVEDNSGYFTLMNPKSGKFLTKNPSKNLTIEGKCHIFLHIYGLFFNNIFFTYRSK